VLFTIGGCLAIVFALLLALVALTGLDDEASPSSSTTGDTRTAQQRIEDARAPLSEAERVEVCSRYAAWNDAQRASSTTTPHADERDTLPPFHENIQEVNMALRMKEQAWNECGIHLILDVPTIDYSILTD
jgi:hypothetical protein